MINVETAAKDVEDQILEVLRPIGGAKRQAARKVTAASRQDCHLRCRVGRVIDLVETFLEIADGDPLTAGDTSLDVIRVGYQEVLPHRDAVKFSVNPLPFVDSF